MEDGAKRKRLADDIAQQDAVAGREEGIGVVQVTTKVDWNKVGGRDKKISFQQGIYTIPQPEGCEPAEVARPDCGSHGRPVGFIHHRKGEALRRRVGAHPLVDEICQAFHLLSHDF